MTKVETATTVEVVEHDCSDDSLVAQLFEIARRSEAVDRVQPVRRTLEEFTRWSRFQWPGEHNVDAVARIDGEPVGFARVSFPERDNVEKAYAEVTVDPGHRNRAVGSTLLEWVERQAVREGRHLALAEVFVPVGERESHAGRDFALHRGYSVASVEIVRLLRLPVAAGVLERFEASSTAAMGQDYEVSVHTGAVPEQLRQGVCDAANRVVLDAPTGEVDFEAETQTVEDYLERISFQASIGMTMLTAVAVHRESGKVAAYSEIGIPAGEPEIAFQWGTLVQPEHRGHRLGMAVKVANLRALTRIAPERTSVRTMNDEQNEWMVAINRDLGFEIIEEALFLKKDV